MNTMKSFDKQLGMCKLDKNKSSSAMKKAENQKQDSRIEKDKECEIKRLRKLKKEKKSRMGKGAGEAWDEQGNIQSSAVRVV